VTRYILGDLRTGRRILDLPVLSGPWEDQLDTAETIRVTVDVNDPDVRALGLRNSAAKAKTFLCVVENGQLRGGPIWTHHYSRDDGILELGAKGLMSVFDHRLILPLLAMTTPVTQWTVPDPSDTTNSGKTIPNPALTTAYTGLWLGSIAKRLVQQAMTWTGGELPIVLPGEESSTDPEHRRTYLGADFKPIGEALKQLMEVQGGPEIRFVPRFTADMLGVEWVMQVGTVAQPLLFSQVAPRWNLTAEESPVTNFEIDSDASDMGSLAWMAGGRQADDVLVSRAYDPTLINQGYPLLELADSSHTTVSVQETLDKWANQAVINGRGGEDVWSFTVKAYPTDDKGVQAGPQVGSYNVGDFCDIIVAPDRDPYLEGGTYRRRIVGLSGDEQGEDVKIQCAPEVVV
jgi:hypothetical protein